MIREAILKINEAEMLKIYHGDNFNTKRIDPKLMDNGNMQNGPGIYFSSLDVAQGYGKDIVYAEVNPKLFIPSRGTVRMHVKYAYKILVDLWKIDKEAMYYLISDWMEILEPEDVNRDDIRELSLKIGSDEVRNFFITLTDSFGIEEFVKTFMKFYPKKLGTYDKDTDFYAIINTKTFLRPTKERI